MSPRLSTLIVLLLLLHLLAACASNHDPSPPPFAADGAPIKSPAQPVPIEIPKQSITPPSGLDTAGWLQHEVSITCAADDCPVQVGVLYFLSPTTDRSYDSWRCTAFLIDQDKIMTSGHCDFSETSEGYFFTRTDAPERTFRKISKRLFKVFSADKNPELSNGRPDAAVFQLDSPITNIRPLTLASGTAQNEPTLTAIVANFAADQETLHLTIGKLECKVHRHERFFPYSLSDMPDVIRVFECQSIKGNSGAPVFAPGSLAVEAVLQGGSELALTAKEVKDKFHRDLAPLEKHQSAIMTSVRCLAYPTPPALKCIEATDEEAEKRFRKTSMDTLNDLRSRQAPGGSYQTQFKALDFAFKSGSDDSLTGREGELMYFPKCRLVDSVTKFAVPSEHLRIGYDEWAVVRAESLGTSISTGTVKAQSANDITVTDMKWAEPFGPYKEGEQDPRKKLGNAFSIALPPCPR